MKVGYEENAMNIEYLSHIYLIYICPKRALTVQEARDWATIKEMDPKGMLDDHSKRIEQAYDRLKSTCEEMENTVVKAACLRVY